MKKVMLISMGAALLLSSCGTYTGAGAYAGGSFGSIIGSAIGGIAGGHRGSDVGTLIGMAGGAMIGAAVGAKADQAEQQKYEDYKAARQEARQRRAATTQRQSQRDDYDSYNYQDDSGYDATNSGDDRLYGFGENFSTVEKVNAPITLEMRNALEIRNARLIDASHDGVLTRGEEARVVFEIYNKSSKPVYRVQPSVAEVTGNKHIHISENILVESIAPGKGVRYTANIKADSYLKNGEAVIRVGVFQNNREVLAQTKEFPIRTSKR